MDTSRPAGFIPQRGFSLFEVLITVIVISIGLLGLAGLQFAGLRAANSAGEHTLATLLAQDIKERIYANKAAVSSGYYDSITPASLSSAALTKDCANVSNNCSPSEMRDFDLYQLKQQIAQPLLPNLSIALTRQGPKFNLAIQWGDPDGLKTLSTAFNSP